MVGSTVSLDARHNDAVSIGFDSLAAIGLQARTAARKLALATTDQKNKALAEAASIIRASSGLILDANTRDVSAAVLSGRPSSFIDRLKLTGERVDAMAESLLTVAALPDPVGTVIKAWDRPNGLAISQVRVPIGVIGMIYESRPNVTADAAALCLKSGNAVILRGGSESIDSNKAIHACLLAGLRAADLPDAALTFIETTDRAVVGRMLDGLNGCIDVIVPRGGKSLVARVQAEARVPVFAHLEGICHVYIDKAADIEKATALVVNAKMRRTGVCGAAEALLVDRTAPRYLETLVQALLQSGCEVRGDASTQNVDTRVKPANDDDWGKEFLDAIIAVRTVDGVEGAMEHIARYGSQHTDAIVTEDDITAACFLREVDSAIVIHNASTQFADGGEFGMGAEIGIATGRFHARGPVGLEQLTTFKYIVRGDGQIRP